MPDKQKPKGMTFLEEDEQSARPPRVLGAITLTFMDDFTCDILPQTVLQSGAQVPVNPNLFGIFKVFLNDICNGITFSEVIQKYIEVKVSESKEKSTDSN